MWPIQQLHAISDIVQPRGAGAMLGFQSFLSWICSPNLVLIIYTWQNRANFNVYSLELRNYHDRMAKVVRSTKFTSLTKIQKKEISCAATVNRNRWLRIYCWTYSNYFHEWKEILYLLNFCEKFIFSAVRLMYTIYFYQTFWYKF